MIRPRELDYLDFDEIWTYYYDVDKGKFMDCDGWLITCLWDLITPNDLFLFRFYKDYLLVPCVNNRKIGIELIGPDYEEED